jgi:hypothetical protein
MSLLEKFNRVVREADMIHPEKKSWMETGDEELNKILPTLSEEEKSYLETITSENYKEVVAMIEKYTGKTVSQATLPSLVYLLQASLDKITEVETSHKKYLEELALAVVFKIPEFKMVEEAYMADELKFDIKLETPDLSRALEEVPPQEEETNLTPEESFNAELFNSFSNLSEEKLKRRFANMLISGGAMSKFEVFKEVESSLNRIDPNLTKLYGIVSSLAQLGYWVTPFGVEAGAAGAAKTKGGSEEVKPKGQIYTITAKAVNFPFLVHEVIKGIYEWIALDPEHQVAMQHDTLGAETKDILSGPGVFKTISSYFTPEQQELMPVVQKGLPKLSAQQIKDVLAKNDNGKRIMGSLIKDAEKSVGTYKKAKTDIYDTFK